MGPPGTQKEEKWKFHICSVGYQNRVKRVIEVHFWRSFWKIFENEDFGFEIFENENWKSNQQKLRVGYVYKEELFYAIFNMGYGVGGVQWAGKIGHGREG